MSKNYYEILGVAPSADTQTIRNAAQTKLNVLKNYYAALPSGQQTQEKLKLKQTLEEIKTAYTILNNEHQRKSYDQELGSITHVAKSQPAVSVATTTTTNATAPAHNPYATPQSKLEKTKTDFDLSNVKYGGFWRRIIALLIDIIVCIFLLSMMVGFFGNIVYYPLAQLLYFALSESSKKQATLGKRLLGLKVVDLAGERLSFLHATGRYFYKILATMIFLLSFIMIPFTKKKQGLHDILARTLVIRG